MARLANMRHERFIREYLKTDFNASEAYRRVYPRHRRDIACVSACQLLRRPKVQQRLQEVQMALISKADITVESILTEYEDARKLAISQDKPEAMLNASEKKAKIVGLLVDRKEVGNAGDFDNMTDVSVILEKVRKEAGVDAALALAKVFGLDEPTIEQPLAELEPPSDAVN